MANRSLFVETFGGRPDPSLIAVGATPKKMIPLAPVLGRGHNLDLVQAAVTQLATAGSPVELPADNQPHRALAILLKAFTGWLDDPMPGARLAAHPGTPTPDRQIHPHDEATAQDLSASLPSPAATPRRPSLGLDRPRLDAGQHSGQRRPARSAHDRCTVHHAAEVGRRQSSQWRGLGRATGTGGGRPRLNPNRDSPRLGSRLCQLPGSRLCQLPHDSGAVKAANDRPRDNNSSNTGHPACPTVGCGHVRTPTQPHPSRHPTTPREASTLSCLVFDAPVQTPTDSRWPLTRAPALPTPRGLAPPGA